MFSVIDIFLQTLHFETLYFLKSYSIFDGPCKIQWKSNQTIHCLEQIFVQKSTSQLTHVFKMHHFGDGITGYDPINMILSWVRC